MTILLMRDAVGESSAASTQLSDPFSRTFHFVVKVTIVSLCCMALRIFSKLSYAFPSPGFLSSDARGCVS